VEEQHGVCSLEENGQKVELPLSALKAPAKGVKFKSDSFLFEFSRIGFLNLCHAHSFPGLLEYTSALLALPIRGRLRNMITQ
jgi:hypothetical protein